MGEEKVIGKFLERKETLFDYKKTDLTKAKSLNFFKRVCPLFL